MLCSICQLPIAEAATAGDRECPFCSTVFSRTDGARRHAKRCPQRGTRALRPGKRGRQALSCDRCSRVKVHCNSRGRRPCDGCITRKLVCSFSRYCTDVAHRGPSAAVSSEIPHSNQRRIALSFLLNSTDDKQDFVTEKAVGKEPDGGLLGPLCGTTPSAGAGTAETLDYIDPTLLLSFNYQPDLVQPYGAEEDLLDTFLSLRSHEDTLAARIDNLESHFTTHIRSGDPYRNEFDPIAFRRFFNVSNVYRFATTFCRKRHYRYPIIHWPSFVLEKASLPLLMVVSLTGASYSYQPGHQLEYVDIGRTLYPLASRYVFDQLSTYMELPSSDIDIIEAIQLAQAALLMYGLDTLLSSDTEVQRMAITQRLPTLVSAIRRMDFLNCRHSVSENWTLFLQREQIIRLVAWTFCADCLATLTCNSPPLFCILEMNGDLPCDPVLWDADTEMGFELLRVSRQQPSHCLKELVSSFLNDNSEPLVDRDGLPIFHLHIILCGFQPIIYNLHVSMLLSKQSYSLLQALGTWRDLWKKALDRIPYSHREWLGVARHVPDLEYLSRRVIEVAVSPKASSSRYLQRIPSYGTREIHEFLRDFVAETYCDRLNVPKQ